MQEAGRALIRLAIIDDNRVLRLGLEAAIASGCGIHLVGNFDLTDDYVSEIEKLKPDLVLMGMKWPAMDRISACRSIKRGSPSTQVLMLASEVRDEEVLASIMAGASGYIAMNSHKTELIRSIHILAGGGCYFESSAVDRVIRRLQEMTIVGDLGEGGSDGLTEREVLILNMIAEGLGNADIGRSLGVSTKTVRNNITELRLKLDLHSRAQMAAYATRREILYELRLRSSS